MAPPGMNANMTSVPLVQSCPEAAVKIIWDTAMHDWRKESVLVRLEAQPFQRGSMRNAHWLQEVGPDGLMVLRECVAKFFDPVTLKEHGFEITRQLYEEDVFMQNTAAEFAARFNRLGAPKRVGYIPAWLLEVGGTVCLVEPMLSGHYEKYNSNLGDVCSMRATPQAFSHFTLEISNGREVVTDVQGVDDVYTDPQIHTSSGHGYGLGNRGQQGIEDFVKSHVCNAVCKIVGLPDIRHFAPPSSHMHHEEEHYENISNNNEVIYYQGRKLFYGASSLMRFNNNNNLRRPNNCAPLMQFKEEDILSEADTISQISTTRRMLPPNSSSSSSSASSSSASSYYYHQQQQQSSLYSTPQKLKPQARYLGEYDEQADNNYNNHQHQYHHHLTPHYSPSPQTKYHRSRNQQQLSELPSGSAAYYEPDLYNFRPRRNLTYEQGVCL